LPNGISVGFCGEVKSTTLALVLKTAASL